MQHGSSHNTENCNKTHPQIESLLGAGDALLQMQKGAKLHLVTTDTHILYKGDGTNVEVKPDTFSLLKQLGLIEIRESPIHTGSRYAVWSIDYRYDHVDFEKTYGAGFVSSLLDPTGKEYVSAGEKTAKQIEFASKMLLVYACDENPEGIKRALQMGANANAIVTKDSELENNDRKIGSSALMLAAYGGPDMLEGVRALVEAGADLSIVTPGGIRLMHMIAFGAARLKNYTKNAEPLIDFLAEAGAQCEFSAEKLVSPLFCTVNEYEGRVSDSAVRALLKHGANPNSVRNNLDILSHAGWSARSGDIQSEAAIQALVLAGANVNPQRNPVESLTSTPLGAIGGASLNLLDFLLAHGASADLVDKKGVSLLEVLKGEKKIYGGVTLSALQREEAIKLLEKNLSKS